MDAIEYNRIDNYLLGRLEGKELADFELQLQTDMEFAERVNHQRKAMDLLRKVGDLEMKKEVREVQDLFNKGKQSKSLLSTLRPWLATAAAIALFVVVYFAVQTPSSEQLFEANYVAYNTGYGDRAESDLIDIKLAEASKLYRQKKYAEAIPLFESIPSEFNEGKFQLMKGITHLELNQFDKAQASFNPIIKEKDPVFQYHALWYSAMAYLKAGDIEKTKTQLQLLIDAQNVTDVYNQVKAIEILKEL